MPAGAADNAYLLLPRCGFLSSSLWLATPQATSSTPFKAWLMVVLIVVIGLAGYIIYQIAGAMAGTILKGVPGCIIVAIVGIALVFFWPD